MDKQLKERVIEIAKKDFEEEGKLEFDDKPKISESEGGWYVQCWVWVDSDYITDPEV